MEARKAIADVRCLFFHQVFKASATLSPRFASGGAFLWGTVLKGGTQIPHTPRDCTHTTHTALPFVVRSHTSHTFSKLLSHFFSPCVNVFVNLSPTRTMGREKIHQQGNWPCCFSRRVFPFFFAFSQSVPLSQVFRGKGKTPLFCRVLSIAPPAF